MLFSARKALLLSVALMLGAPSASARSEVRCPEAFANLAPGASIGDGIDRVISWFDPRTYRKAKLTLPSREPTPANFDYDKIIAEIERLEELLHSMRRAAPAPSETHTGDFKPGSLAATYEAFAQHGQLLNQTDHRLYSANLIVANGGLCASACAVNVFGPAVAGLEAAPHYNFVNADVIKLIVEKYPDILRAAGEAGNGDARFGAFPHLILQAMESHLTANGAKLKDHFYPRPYDLSDPDSISVVTALLGDGAGYGIQGAHSAHAMVLLKLDPQRKEVLMSDPNEPNRIFRAFYTQGLDNEIIFPLHLNYGTSGPTYARVVRAQVLTRQPGQ